MLGDSFMHFRLTVAVLLTIGLADAQAPTQDPGSLKFEVASVKRSAPEARGGVARPEPGGLRYRGTNLPLKAYISSAYRIKGDQVMGAPSWVDTDGFDIEAQAAKPSSLEEFHLMTRALLAERFHLKFHFETREMPLYALVVDASGAKLTLHDAANSGEPWIEQGMDVGASGLPRPFHQRWTATSSSMELFAFRLASVMDRPVIDQTGLKGEYDFKLTYTANIPLNLPENAMINGQPIDTSGPSIFQAVRQQLGLRLDGRKGPVQIIVIDHVEKPSEN
jgi:uncharacterized protein (TIGR03435 family)